MKQANKWKISIVKMGKHNTGLYVVRRGVIGRTLEYYYSPDNKMIAWLSKANAEKIAVALNSQKN